MGAELDVLVQAIDGNWFRDVGAGGRFHNPGGRVDLWGFLKLDEGLILELINCLEG